METRKPTHSPVHMKDAAFPDGAEQRSLRTSWRGVTRRAILLATCAATASTLMFPSASFAAEWVNVDGTQYDQAAGDEAGTWSWDGADAMNLNGYEGSGISAAGKLEITYTGENNVTVDTYDDGISVIDGENEDAVLTITGDEGSKLTVEAKVDAIYSEGDVTISGEGTVEALGGVEDDAINSGGNVKIEDGTVVAVGGDDAIYADGDVSIKNANVKASGVWGIYSGGETTITNSQTTADAANTGIYSDDGLTVDNSTLKTSVGLDYENPNYGGIGIYVYGDVTIKNGSLVDVVAKNSSTAYGIYAEGYNNKDCRIVIADSTVTATATATGTDNPDGTDNPEIDNSMGVGIHARSFNTSNPATIDISRSNVTAEGTSAAILARNYNYASKNPEFGTITIKDSTITVPQGGKLAKYEYSYDRADDRSGDEEEPDYGLDRGMTIVSADANTDEVITDESLLDVIAKKAVIEADKEPEPTPEIKPAGYVTPTGGTGEKKAIPQTGDASGAGLIASAIAGASALATGLFMTRKRES